VGQNFAPPVAAEVHRLQNLSGLVALLVFQTHSEPPSRPHPVTAEPPVDGIVHVVPVKPLIRALRQPDRFVFNEGLQSHWAPARRLREEQLTHELAMKASRTRRISPSVTCVLVELYPPIGAQFVVSSTQYPEIPQSPLGPGHVVICFKAVPTLGSVASLAPKHWAIAVSRTNPATFWVKDVPTALVGVKGSYVCEKTSSLPPCLKKLETWVFVLKRAKRDNGHVAVVGTVTSAPVPVARAMVLPAPKISPGGAGKQLEKYGRTASAAAPLAQAPLE